MEGQFLIAQLPLLLEDRTVQHCFGRQALPSGGLDADPHQIAGHRAKQIATLIQLLRHRLQFIADLVRGENIEYAGLDGAFLAHCLLRWWRGIGISGIIQDT